MPFTPLDADFYGFQLALSSDEQARLHDLREFLEREVRPVIDEAWHTEQFPHELVRPFGATGLFGPLWDETKTFENSAEFRGWVAAELARVDASFGTFYGVQNGLVMGSIGVGGSPEQRAEWLPKLASCEVTGAFALTEPLSGSDSSQGLRTTATREGDEWVLNGEKRWIGNATFSDITIVWAKDTEDGQVKGFIVPTDTPGYSATKIDHKISLRTVQNADITLENVRVPESLRLQQATSFRTTAQVLRLTRADVAWAAVGVQIGAYEAAVAYAKERIQFGRPIGSHQLVQDLLAKALGNVTASIALCTQVSRMQDEDRQGDAHSALAKGWVTARMRETVAWCREIVGGNGIVTDYGVARHFADAEALYSYEGTFQMNSLIVGRAITGESAFV